MKRLFIATISIIAIVLLAQAQIERPVTWSSTIKTVDDKHVDLALTANIEDGWHMYSNSLPKGGPTPLTIDWSATKGATPEGELKPSKGTEKQHDANFGMDLTWWTGKVTLTQRFKITEPQYDIAGNVRFMSCNDKQCVPPESWQFTHKGNSNAAKNQSDDKDAQAKSDETALESEAQLPPESPRARLVATNAPSVTRDELWAPVDTSGSPDAGSTSGRSLLYIFVACFIGGLLALITPCVWPMIPLTVSFFLKKSGSRKKSISNAITYGISIIAIYLLLGILVTVIFGASSLNALATNAVCNIIFFLLLVVFAISFFGAFELTLPGSWSNKMDSTAAKTTGLLSIFFMAATLVIVSFSCTGPIIGTLLVEAASQGNIIGPAVGMFGFALALAIPFTLFALFPSFLKKLPKSGGWLNTVKVTLGFIELALSLKFLSVADLAYGWHILDRETFLALWIAIFGTLGLYLLGVFHFKSDGDKPKRSIGVTRFFAALASLAFTAYLIPGLWGAPLKATSAFVPPLNTQDFNLYGRELVTFYDYDAGMAQAAKLNKPVFVDFSGFGCVNCRKMEGAVLDNENVRSLINENFVTIQLMVDDKRDLREPFVVNENGNNITLTTIGDKWSFLQRHKFASNSQPYYVILDTHGKLLSGPVAYDEDIDHFVAFLKKGLENNQ